MEIQVPGNVIMRMDKCGMNAMKKWRKLYG